MSAHVKVWRGRIFRRTWFWSCNVHVIPAAKGHHTHAEALAAAWAHIKEHS